MNIGVYGARGIPSTYSGYETFLTELLPALAERGHSVTMYCRRAEVDATADYRGVRRVIVPSIRTKAFDTLSHGAASSVASSWARHDVVLVVNVGNSLVCWVNRLTGQSVVLNTDGQEWMRDKWGHVAKRVFRISAVVARWSANALVSDCSAMAEVYQHEFASESTVIPYSSRGTSMGGGDLSTPFGLAPRGYFLHAARLNPENNATAVARAYLRTSIEMPLVILGAANYDSPVSRELQHLASSDSRLQLLGHVGSRSDFARLLRDARVYVHAHSVGGINPSLVEAMDVGAYIVALRTPFNQEALGNAGIYFDSFGSRLSDIFMAEAANGPGSTDTIRQSAAARARELYSLDAVVDAYESLLVHAGSVRWKRVVPLITRWDSR